MRKLWQSGLRVRLALGALVFVAVGWPTTAVLQALGFPLFEQVMLFLSWIAPAYTAVDMLFTAQIKEGETSDEHDGHSGELD